MDQLAYSETGYKALKGGLGWGGGEERKEGGRKKRGEGIGERRKGTPAIITPFCSPLRMLVSANSDWLIRK